MFETLKEQKIERLHDDWCASNSKTAPVGAHPTDFFLAPLDMARRWMWMNVDVLLNRTRIISLV